MAHYARLGVNNVVVQIDIVDNSIITNSGGLERDALAFQHLAGLYGAGMWVKCSYNTAGGVHGLGGTPLRANYPGGAYDEDNPWYYDTTHDIFRKNRPKDKDGEVCASWTLNTTTCLWEPPVAYPSDDKSYVWDETTKSWVEEE